MEKIRERNTKRRRHRLSKKRARKRKLILLGGMILLLMLAIALSIFYFTHKPGGKKKAMKAVSGMELELNGKAEITVGKYGIFEDPGAVAKISGEEVKKNITSGDTVDTSKPGNYELSYEYENSKVIRKVVVEKEMSPVLEINGEDEYSLKLGDSFEEPGFTAKTKEGKDITDKVVVDNAGLNHAGDQQIVYTVQDEKGNITRRERRLSIAPNKEYKSSGLAICMFHYVYDKNSPPETLTSNHIEKDALAEEFKYLQDNQYYYPTWDEVRDYLEGKLILPEKSVVITFDDGPTFMEIGIPLLQQYQVKATSFVITSYFNSKEMLESYRTEYLDFQSHSNDMHRGGGSLGHGGIFTSIGEEDALTDLQRSVEICGSGKAFAYPFGDYTEAEGKILEKAGFLCAVTTENGKIYPGDDPYKLKRVRMLGTQSVESFASAIK